MGQTFLGSLLLSKLRPVLGLMNSCSSICVRENPKFSFPSFMKCAVRRTITWTCVPPKGYWLPCVRCRRHQAYSSLISNCSITTVSSPQIVMQASIRRYSSSSEKKHESADKSEHSGESGDPYVAPERLSLFKRFKQMYRDYWYVLIPVHVVTSVGWFGAFYYACVSGIDVVAALESLNISDKIINPLRDSKAGYVALSYALYKIATPLRYTVTLGGTTVSINYLKKWGYLKPIPPREKLKEMYDEKKENLIERKDALMKETAEQFKERKENFMRSYRSKK